jgi:SnoaL-like domain
MDDIQRMLIERACERLVTEYCHFVDHGEAAKIADQFTEDGVWASGRTVRNGRAEIAAAFSNRQNNAARISRHVCCNLLVNVIDENNATGVVYLTLYRHDGEPGRRSAPSDVPNIVGEYRDTFVRTANGWRFKRRDVGVSFVRTDDAAASAHAKA